MSSDEEPDFRVPRERSKAPRTARKSAGYATLPSGRTRADMHVNASITEVPQSAVDAHDGNFIGGDADDLMRRKADPLAPAPGEPISSGRVLWGVVAGGQKFPHFLAGDRRVIELARDLMPADDRDASRIVRVHVTMWRFDHDPQEPVPGKKRARKVNPDK